jgi:hypothetical protein
VRMHHYHTHVHACIHTCVHTYIHTHTCMHTYIHTCMHTYKPSCIHAYIYTYVHTYMHTYVHTYIHIHAYMHMNILQTIRLLRHHTCVPVYPSRQPLLPVHEKGGLHGRNCRADELELLTTQYPSAARASALPPTHTEPDNGQDRHNSPARMSRHRIISCIITIHQTTSIMHTLIISAC